MFRRSHGSLARRRIGLGLPSTLLVLVALLGIGGTLALGTASRRGSRSGEAVARAEFLAQAGISDKLSQLMAGNYVDLGSSRDPIPSPGGNCWVAVETLDASHELFRLTARARSERTGRTEGASRTIQTVVRSFADTVVHDALFAGDSSGEDDYVLALGGIGERADRVRGDVYSGNAISVTGDAAVDGVLRARGRIAGARGSEATSRSIGDFARLRAAAARYVDVGQSFAGAALRDNPLGGTAGELPKESPAHLFRKNPSDRAVWTAATAGDDYFLEDPYEPVERDVGSDGSDATRVYLSPPEGGGASAEAGSAFTIDGDLWVFNRNTNSFRLSGPREFPRVLVVAVRGNIHVADNLYFQPRDQDGIVLIALKDPARSDSGNIVLGDPEEGTLREIDAFLLAEGDILGCSLGLEGSRRLAIRGSLAAGNQVKFGPAGSGSHVQLAIEHDERLLTGRLVLPGLPAGIRRATAFTVLSWKDGEGP
jgi:hypothetical protein